jgi:gas vesicle protein
MKWSRKIGEMRDGILLGSALGAAGAVAGIFLAPKSGKRLRSAVCRRASRFWDKIEAHL